MKLLLIEDDADLSKVVSSKLQHERFVVDQALDGFLGLQMAVSNAYDLIITDLTLPLRNGEQICTQLRGANFSIPIIALTASDDLHTKLKLFNVGIDDYIIKPFSFAELVARIKACLRKHELELKETLNYDELSINTRKRTISRAGKNIHLRNKEAKILEYLLMHPDQVLTREMIISYVWGPSVERYTNVVDVHIHSLRDKIDKPFGYPLLQTVNNIGYKISKIRNTEGRTQNTDSKRG